MNDTFKMIIRFPAKSLTREKINRIKDFLKELYRADEKRQLGELTEECINRDFPEVLDYIKMSGIKSLRGNLSVMGDISDLENLEADTHTRLYDTLSYKASIWDKASWEHLVSYMIKKFRGVKGKWVRHGEVTLDNTEQILEDILEKADLGGLMGLNDNLDDLVKLARKSREKSQLISL